MPFDAAMKTFRRECNNAEIVTECRRRRYFEDAVTERKRKEKERFVKLKKYKTFRPQSMSDRVGLADLPLWAEDFGFGLEDMYTARESTRRTYRDRNPRLPSSEEPVTQGEDAPPRGDDHASTSRAKIAKVSVLLENWAQVARVLGYKGATIRSFSATHGVRIWVPTDEGGRSINFEVIVQGEDDKVQAALPVLQKLVAEGPAAVGLPEAPEVRCAICTI